MTRTAPTEPEGYLGRAKQECLRTLGKPRAQARAMTRLSAKTFRRVESILMLGLISRLRHALAPSFVHLALIVAFGVISFEY